MVPNKALLCNCADTAVWYNDTPCLHIIYHNALGWGGVKEPRIRCVSRSAHVKVQFVAERTCPGMPEDTAVSCAKMVEQIEMLFGFWTRVGRMKRRRCGQAYVKLLLKVTDKSYLGNGAIRIETWLIHLANRKKFLIADRPLSIMHDPLTIFSCMLYRRIDMM